MQQLIDNYPIGTLPTDYSNLCQDCLKPDHLGNFAYRQVYLRKVSNSKPAWVPTRLPGGAGILQSVYPVEQYKYCYYHCQQRDLLPYQDKRKYEWPYAPE